MKRWQKSEKKEKKRKYQKIVGQNIMKEYKKYVVVKKETEEKDIPSFNIYKSENTSPITAGDC